MSPKYRTNLIYFMSNCKPMSTPMLLSFNYDLHEFNHLSDESTKCSKLPIIMQGAHWIPNMCLVDVCTRPDITIAVNTVARFSDMPSLLLLPVYSVVL